MKKWLFLFISLLVGIAVAMPWVMGELIERNIEKVVKRLDRSPLLTARLVYYQSRYRNGSGRIQLGLDPQALNLNSDADFSTELELSVFHGPHFGATEFGLLKVLVDFTELPNELSPSDYGLKSVVGFTGNARTRAMLPPLNVSEQGVQLKFSGANADLNVDLLSGRWDTVIRSSLLAINEGQESFELREFNVVGRGEPSRSLVPPMTLKLSAGEWRIFSDGRETFMENAQFNTILRPDNSSSSLLALEQQLELEKLSANYLSEPLADVALAFRAERIQPAALLELRESGEEAQKRFVDALVAESPKLIIERISLGKDAAQTLDAKVQGAINAQRIGGGSVVTTPFLLMAALELEAQLLIQESLYLQIAQLMGSTNALPDANEEVLASQTQASLELFIQQGFVRREGDKLIVDAIFKDGSLSVSGKPIPLLQN